MSQQVFDVNGNGYTNLINPRVYNTANGLACGWKWTCQDPCCKGADKSRCSCCDMCQLGFDDDDADVPEGGDAPQYDTRYTYEPCCYNGTCCACKEIAGDVPPIYPQAIGCGTRHTCKTIKTLPLCREQLDLPSSSGGHADLPGRPPHTIVCVRATGVAIVQDEECLRSPDNTYWNDLNLINPNCDSYNLWVRFKIPLEVIVRDCAGYLYCLKSFMTELVRIPLTARLHNLSGVYIYAKTRVRLCYPNQAEATPLYDANGDSLGAVDPTMPECTPSNCGVGPTFPFNCITAIVNNRFREEVATNLAECLLDMDNDERDCHFDYTFGTYPCLDRDDPAGPDYNNRCSNGNPRLDILVEACVMRLTPGGIGGGSYICNNTGI
jgi:hypothetical protein